MAVALAALVAGCGFADRGDKAGGSEAPVVLHLAVAYPGDTPDAPVARFFASRVAALSGGSMCVRVVFDAAGERIVDPEAGVASMVGDGTFELGWIGARAWDRLGVSSFQALQAPFLVTSYALLGRIATGRRSVRDGERLLLPQDADALRRRGGYERLDDDQRHALREAAEQTVARVVAHPPVESALARLAPPRHPRSRSRHDRRRRSTGSATATSRRTDVRSPCPRRARAAR
jgi:hypothetical protein